MGGLVGSMVVSGIDRASAESESTGYDPNETREANRRENSMAALQGKLYVAGGHDGNNSLATAEAFDPQQNRWEAVAPMAQARHSFSAAAI